MRMRALLLSALVGVVFLLTGCSKAKGGDGNAWEERWGLITERGVEKAPQPYAVVFTTRMVTMKFEEACDLGKWIGVAELKAAGCYVHAKTSYHSNDPEGTIKALEDVLDALKRLDREKYSDELLDLLYADAYMLLGSAHLLKGRHDEAVKHLNEALEIYRRILGPEHPDAAQVHGNLGNFYSAKGDYDRAIEHYEKALKIRVKTLGPENPDVALTYNNLGAAYQRKGDYDKALEYYTKALSICLKALGPEHPCVALTYSNLGYAYADKGDYGRALEYFNRALETAQKIGHRRLYESIKKKISELRRGR